MTTTLYTEDDFGKVHNPTEVLHVHVYRYRWNRDYSARVRERVFFAMYDLETAERIPF
jgi:hypothetical protein